jgi:hypothetical protein
MDTEEAEVVAGTEARCNQPLFRFCGRGFFNDILDRIEIVPALDPFPGHSPKIREKAFTRRLYRRDRTGFRFRSTNNALCAAGYRSAYIEMIPYKVQKRLPVCEVPGTPQGMSVPPRFMLIHKGQAPGMVTGHGPECTLIVGVDDEAHITDSGPNHFFNNHGQNGFLLAIPVNKSLQGKTPLSSSGGGDDRFGDFHVPFSRCKCMPLCC